MLHLNENADCGPIATTWHNDVERNKSIPCSDELRVHPSAACCVAAPVVMLS